MQLTGKSSTLRKDKRTPEIRAGFKADWVCPCRSVQRFDAVELSVSAWWCSCHFFLSLLFPADAGSPSCSALPRRFPFSERGSVASWVFLMTRGGMQCHFSQGLSSVSPPVGAPTLNTQTPVKTKKHNVHTNTHAFCLLFNFSSFSFQLHWLFFPSSCCSTCSLSLRRSSAQSSSCSPVLVILWGAVCRMSPANGVPAPTSLTTKKKNEGN